MQWRNGAGFYNFFKRSRSNSNIESIFVSIFILGFLSFGCSCPEVSQTRRTEGQSAGNRILVIPESTVLGNAIGVELFQRGFDVVEGPRARSIFQKYPIYWRTLTLEQLNALKKEGLDYVLTVESSELYEGVPQNAVINLLNTQNGEIVAAVNWQSGDDFFTTSTGVVDAANQITNELIRGLQANSTSYATSSASSR
jgi:hypothetical protein